MFFSISDLLYFEIVIFEINIKNYFLEKKINLNKYKHVCLANKNRL